MRRDGAETRRQRIEEIKRMLIGADKFPLKKLLALISMKWGLTLEKGREYLEVLQTMGMISIDNDFGTVSWVEEADKPPQKLGG